MNFDISMTGLVAAYVFMLAAFAGWVIIGRVPAILHTPLMSGSNFVHGIVVVGGIFALLNATSGLQELMGFLAVLFGAGNVAGGFVVTHRMLAMFKPTRAAPAAKASGAPKARARRAPKAAPPETPETPETHEGAEAGTGESAPPPKRARRPRKPKEAA